MKTIVPDGQGGATFLDIPMPELFDNAALCRVTHSVISTGTERLMIRAAVGRSLDDIREAGIRLGYCGAGVVERVCGSDIALGPGQAVAFYGAPYGSHSEYVVVPRHLVLPIPDGMDPPEAAFIGIGAIALHGFRKGRVCLGETCFVAGAGIIGNLCAQLARVAGCRVVVSDPDPVRLEVLWACVGDARDFATVAPDDAKAAILELSDGRGADAALICASTPSAAPMEQAIDVVIPGGRIVVVGVFDIHVPREPFFQKEAEITISRAGGPGRYDVHYERDGIDYPPQYSRWTEGRNLAAVLRWLGDGRLRAGPLISETFPVASALDTYSLIMAGKDRLGYVIEWT